MRIYRDSVTNKDYIWYSPNEIVFRREQIIFLIEHWELLCQGIYPPEPSSNYIEVSTISIVRPNWKSAENIHAEISKRLETTKDSGETLIWEVTHGMTDYLNLSPVARKALNYITGWKRRKQTFPGWCYNHNRKFRKKSEFY